MARRSQPEGFLDGHLLMAMPSMADKRFARAVVYICAQSADGAMGIVINKLANEVNFRDLLVQGAICRRPIRAGGEGRAWNDEPKDESEAKEDCCHWAGPYID